MHIKPEQLRLLTEDIRAQIEEATDPDDPMYFSVYQKSIIDGLVQVPELCQDDLTYLALALVNGVRFTDVFTEDDAELALQEGVDMDWQRLRGVVETTTRIRNLVVTLESKGFEEQLTIVCVALKIHSKSLHTSEGVTDDES